MAWIHMIPEAEATGRLKELYEKYTEPWGGVDNILKIHSLNPRSMDAHFTLYVTGDARPLRFDTRAAGDDRDRVFRGEPVPLLNQTPRSGAP